MSLLFFLIPWSPLFSLSLSFSLFSLSLSLFLSLSFSLFSLSFLSLFSLFSPSFLSLFSLFLSLSLSFSLSLSLSLFLSLSLSLFSLLSSLFSSHTETEFSRQMTLPTENGHAGPPVESRKSCESVNPHCKSEPGEFSRVEAHWAAGSTPGWCPRGHPPKLGQHWLPSHWSFDPILSASDGTCEECATTDDNDAIGRGHARARWWRWALTLALLVPDCAPHLSFASDTEAVMLSWWWCAPVYDTDCLQPLKQTHGCSLWSSGNCWRRWCRWFLDTGGCVVTGAAVVVCQWLHDMRLWLAVAGLGFCIWRVRLLCCALWKQFSRLQKAFCFCEKLTLLHLVPVDEAPASSSMLRAVCAAVCTLAEHCGAGVQIDTFKVGLDFEEELGQVFGHLLADRVLAGAHVRPVQRLSVSREVPLDVAQFDVRPDVAHDAAKFRSNVLRRAIQNQEPGCELGVTRACVHVRVDRVDHVQECLLRDPVRRGVRHELARKVWSMRVYSAALPLIDNLCPHAASHVRSERDRDEGARGEDMGWLGPLGPPSLACWNDAHSCLVQVPVAILWDSEAIAQVDDAQLQKFTLSCNVSLARPVAGVSRRELPWELQAAQKLPRPSSAGLEFDVELAQHTAVDVLPSGDAEAEAGGSCARRAGPAAHEHTKLKQVIMSGASGLEHQQTHATWCVGQQLSIDLSNLQAERQRLCDPYGLKVKWWKFSQWSKIQVAPKDCQPSPNRKRTEPEQEPNPNWTSRPTTAAITTHPSAQRQTRQIPNSNFTKPTHVLSLWPSDQTPNWQLSTQDVNTW